MTDTTKQPTPFEPIPVGGGPAAVLDIPRSLPAPAQPPTRPAPRQTMPIPPAPQPPAPISQLSDLESAKAVPLPPPAAPRTPLPPDIASEVPLTPEPNPLAGTPAPKASVFSGLVWDLIRPNRAKVAVLAGVASLGVGAFGLSLFVPSFGTQQPQQSKVKVKIPAEEPPKEPEKPLAAAPAPVPRPTEGGWNPLDPGAAPLPVPPRAGDRTDLPPLPDTRQPEAGGGTAGGIVAPRVPGEMPLPALPPVTGELPIHQPPLNDPNLQRVGGTGGPGAATTPTPLPVPPAPGGLPVPGGPAGPAAPLPLVPGGPGGLPQPSGPAGAGGPTTPDPLPGLPPITGLPAPGGPAGPGPAGPGMAELPPITLGLPGAGSETGTGTGAGPTLPTPGLPVPPPVGGGPLPPPGRAGGDPLPTPPLPAALPTTPTTPPTLPGSALPMVPGTGATGGGTTGGGNTGTGNTGTVGTLPLPLPTPQPLEVRPTPPDLPPLGGGGLPPVGTPPRPEPRAEVERTGGTGGIPGLNDSSIGGPVGRPAATLQPPVTEPKTEYDVDLHRPRAGDTYATVSKAFYGGAQYATALQAFNGNKPIERVPELQVPPVHVIRKYAPARAAEPVADKDRFQPTRPGTDDDPVWGPPGTAQGGQVVYDLFTVRRKGLTLKDVAKTYYGSERNWTKLNNARNPKFDPDEELPVGTQLHVPTETVPFR